MMARRLSTVRALLVLGACLVGGAGTGVAGHALTGTTPPAGRAASPNPSANANLSGSTTPSASASASTSSAGAGLLGAGNILSTDDFTAVGWHDMTMYSEYVGEPQFDYACQRRSLAAAGHPAGTISAAWNLEKTFSAAETVGEMMAPPQARALFATLTRWYGHCRAGNSGPYRASTVLDTVRTQNGVARIWRIDGPGAHQREYGIVARDEYRIGLVDVYTDLRPPDPRGLGDLARSALDRLG